MKVKCHECNTEYNTHGLQEINLCKDCRYKANLREKRELHRLFREANPKVLKSSLKTTDPEQYKANSRAKAKVAREADPEKYKLRNSENTKRQRERRLASGDTNPKGLCIRCEMNEISLNINKTGLCYACRNREKAKRYRARKANAEGCLSHCQDLSILQEYNFSCPYCSADLHKEYNMDHIVPLNKGGSNWAINCQPLCISCNNKKSDKLPWDYENEIGFTRDINFWDNLELYNTPECVKMFVEGEEVIF